MYSNAKSLALIRDLADRLNARLAANAASGTALNTVTESFFVDANGASWPVLTISNATLGLGATAPVVMIEIKNVDAVSKDIFGNQTFAYAPHLLKFAYELNANGGSIATHADLEPIRFEAQTCGCEWQLIEVANGTAVTAAVVDAQAPVVDIQPLYWPTKSV
jgi:hypothetical protein